MKIVIGGMREREVEEAMKKTCPEVETIVTMDVGAVPLLKDGRADYCFGACKSGGGAVISILIRLMGYGKCYTVCKNGGKPNEEEIRKYVKDGKICFGMMVSDIDGTVPVLVKVFLEQEGH